MIVDILLLIGGLVLILGGANYMTDGAVAVAKKMGMSDFIVGLTVVSMMTSAPELVVSITSAFNASTDMAIGNIVGSNIFNIMMIVGIVALVRPITVKPGILVNEIPLVLLSSVVLLVMGCAPWLDGTPMQLTRVDGIILLLFFIVFMRYTVASSKRTPPSETEKEESNRRKPMKTWVALVALVGGLAALIGGGDMFVDGATGLARRLGWSEALIGLTILAAGTSLPELATSVAAALKGFPGLCLGNVIGSNIFNIFMVLGLTATIKPLQFGQISLFDLLVLAGSSLLFWIVGRFNGTRLIKRGEGALMVAIYVAYIVTLYITM